MIQRNNDQHSQSSMAWNHWLPRQRPPPWGGSFIYSSISGPTLEWFPSCVRFSFLPKIDAQQGYLVCSFQRVSLARISRMVGEHVNLFLLSGNGRRRGELTYFFFSFSLAPPGSLWDPIPLTRGQTHALNSESRESKLLDHQGIPQLCVFKRS